MFLSVFLLNLLLAGPSLIRAENRSDTICENINFSDNFADLVFGVAPTGRNYNFGQSPEKVENFGASYIFTVKMPKAVVRDIPTILGYYKGEQLNFDSNFCIIHEDLKTSSFTIIVTPDISRKAEDKNVYCLERKENLPCKIFYVNQVEKASKSENSADYDIEWHIEKETNLKEMPKKLPDNAIVILLDPEYVDDFRVLDNQKNLEVNGKAVIIRLPVLILKLKNNDTKDIKSFQESFDHALIAAIDQKPIHVESNKLLAKKIDISVPSTVMSVSTKVNS